MTRGGARGAAAVVALALGCGAPDAPPNLLWIVSDTLRADAVDCAERPDDTPHLCALAARGVRFERAYSAAPWTLPSSAAMFSGSHPSRFGRFGPGADVTVEERDESYHIPDEEVLLAERLVERGYEAVYSVQSGLADKPNTFQGMRELPVDPEAARRAVTPFLPRVESMRTSVYNKTLAGLQYLAGAESPFFLLVWIQDPHAPYRPRRMKSRIDVRHLKARRPIGFYASLGHDQNPKRRMRDFAPDFTPDELAIVRELYRVEVMTVDERVGTLLDLLEKRGLAGRTYVLFTSDHGEAFGEHGTFLHGQSFYDELVRVPLILAGPGIPAGRTVAQAVAHVDLAPTLCDLLRADCAGDAQGRSLRPLLEGQPDAPREQYLTSPLRLAQDALVADGFKLIEGGGRTELYALDADPAERHDVAGQQPERVARMRDRLAAIRAENEALRQRNAERTGRDRFDAVGEETRRQLEVLGYVE